MARVDFLVISSVMDSKQVLPHEIPEESNRLVDPDDLDSINGSKRYFRARGFAEFDVHQGCQRKWRSAHVWVIMDLKTQRITHYYQQSCKHCECKVYPEFEEEALQRMANWAVDEYLHRSRRVRRTAIRRDPIPDEYQCERPHDYDRCDMCKRLGRPCMSSENSAFSGGERHSTSSYVDATSSNVDNVYAYEPATVPTVTLSNRSSATSSPTTRVDWGSNAGQGLQVRGYTQPNYNQYSRRNRNNGCCVIS